MCCKRKSNNSSSCCRRRRNRQGPLRTLFHYITGSTTNRNAQGILQSNTDNNANAKLYESTVSLAPNYYATGEDEKWAQQHGYGVEKGGQQQGTVETVANPPKYEFVSNEK